MSNLLAAVNAIYTAFSVGDIPTILSYMADDVQWEQWSDNRAQAAGVPWLAPRSGKAGVVEFFQALGTLTQVTDFQVLSMMVGSNQVAVEFVIEFDLPTLDAHLRDEEIHLWTFNEDGKVIRLRHYADTAKHIAAAKLS
jgi:hypothetical protein